jgi:hypothetical protein
MLAMVRDAMPEPLLQILGRDARQRHALNVVAGAFPCLARNAQHRRLAGARHSP